MELLLKKLGLSIKHLECLDAVFRESNEEYRRIEEIFSTEPFSEIYKKISNELYAGGKTSPNSKLKLNRQMILGDVIEYIFSGRAYYFATKSDENFKNFMKLIFYCVNQILLFDTITINPELRKLYIEKLEQNIPHDQLYQKEGDEDLAEQIKESDIVIWTNDWTNKIDMFIDSLLPKTLGTPKELVVFAELIRQKRGMVIPLLLIQRIFGEHNPIAPPDFLLIRKNKDIYGIEVGYKKELQSREFSIRTAIPTFAIDLKNNMHNRCPVCGENILYCDPVIEAYSSGILNGIVKTQGGKFHCISCTYFNNGECKFSNYYGKAIGDKFNGEPLEDANRHFHTACVRDKIYTRNQNETNILQAHRADFFAQLPEIDGLENL